MFVICCGCWIKLGLLIDNQIGRMKFTRNRRDRGLIRLDKKKIWLANNTSEAHVVLA